MTDGAEPPDHCQENATFGESICSGDFGGAEAMVRNDPESRFGEQASTLGCIYDLPITGPWGETQWNKEGEKVGLEVGQDRMGVDERG